MYDLLIKNGTILNGTGSPSFYGDIGIKAGKIACIGKGLEGAKTVIDAAGLTVTPGFIDSHSHSDSAVLEFPELLEKIEQGITTSVAGQCGSSPAPISRDADPETAPQVASFGKTTDVYATAGTFLDTLKQVPTGSNTATFIGHGALRKAAMGMDNREPTAAELDKMKALLREGMDHGALGVSFGLIYTPSCYAKTDELIEIAKVVGEYHGVVSAHIRNEGPTLIQAVEEFLTVIRAAKVRGVISHHKSSGKVNWGKIHTTLRMIDQANADGLDVYCDVYPYIASNTTLAATFVPAAMHEQGVVKVLQDPKTRAEIKEWNRNRRTGDLSYVQVSSCRAYPQYEGKRIPEIARQMGVDEYEAVFTLIADSSNNASACYFTMCEEDVETVMAHPRAMICTDSGVARTNPVFHPRLKASFPRVLGHYVRERKVTSLPEMIRKITSMPASVYGLKTKGLLWEGMDADICIFDAEKIVDKATFTACNQRAEGLNYVILGGEIVVRDAVYQGGKPGRFLSANLKAPQK